MKKRIVKGMVIKKLSLSDTKAAGKISAADCSSLQKKENWTQEKDILQVYANWESGFGDTGEEIAAFFAAFMKEAEVYVVIDKTRVAGQLCLLPVKLVYSAAGCLQSLDAVYIYAVATASSYRKKGVATYLLEEIKKALKERRLCGVLVPADKELAAFYEKRGFSLCFEEEQIPIKAAEAMGSLQKCSPEAYIDYRKKAFAQLCRVQEPDAMALYAVNTFLAEGGFCCAFMYEEKIYGILYKEPGQIREITAGDREEAVRVAEALLETLGQDTGVLQRSFLTYGIYLPEGTDRTGYFNLVLE